MTSKKWERTLGLEAARGRHAGERSLAVAAVTIKQEFREF